MNWFGPSNGSCSCCEEGECGYTLSCECCENYVVRDRPDVTFTLGGSIGAAQPLSYFSCGPATTLPTNAEVLGDYVISCKNSVVYILGYWYSSKMCTIGSGFFATDIYHEISLEAEYLGQRNPFGFLPYVSALLRSEPVGVNAGVDPNTAAGTPAVRPVSSSFGASESRSGYSAQIAKDTCRPLINESVTGTPGLPGGGQIDVSGVTITATLAT